MELRLWFSNPPSTHSHKSAYFGFGEAGWTTAFVHSNGAAVWLYALTKSKAGSKEHAQNGRGSERTAQRASEFLVCLAARIRAAQRASEFLVCLAARIRALCALGEHAQNGRGSERTAQRAS